MKEIREEAKTIRQLLSGTRYFIDYYQREYEWQTKQVRELLDDLAGRSLEGHKASNDRTVVQGYGHYFLGSIIISQKSNKNFIIDGQQRLTTLTLLLIYPHRPVEVQPDISHMTHSLRPYGQFSLSDQHRIISDGAIQPFLRLHCTSMKLTCGANSGNRESNLP